ncbi:MAG: GNAT family N-acetyltransferase [Acidobacteria bacterium]|nr:GNAT family N-acetyltransferase [Acidobacteriota bacterium]
MSDVVTESSRLRIRRLRSADAVSLQRVYGDPDATRWIGDGRTLSLEQCSQWIETSRHEYDARGYGLFALESRATQDVVGFAGLLHPNGHPTPELKYALRKDQWGRGYATEAVRALLRHAVGLRIREIVAVVAPENGASISVLLKVGMTPAGGRIDADGAYTQVFAWRSLAR